MEDVIFICITLIFFGLCFGLIGFFDFLTRSK